MKVYVYRTSGGKTILSTLSKEVKPTVLTVLDGMKKDGVKNFYTKPIDKNITPILYEIKKKYVRIFYYILISSHRTYATTYPFSFTTSTRRLHFVHLLVLIQKDLVARYVLTFPHCCNTEDI